MSFLVLLLLAFRPLLFFQEFLRSDLPAIGQFENVQTGWRRCTLPFGHK